MSTEPCERYLMTTTYLGMSRHGNSSYGHHINGNPGPEPHIPTERDSQLAHYFKKLMTSLSNIEEWVKGKRREDICRTEWLLLARALDRMFLIMYITSFLVSTLTILTGHDMFRIGWTETDAIGLLYVIPTIRRKLIAINGATHHDHGHKARRTVLRHGKAYQRFCQYQRIYRCIRDETFKPDLFEMEILACEIFRDRQSQRDDDFDIPMSNEKIAGFIEIYPRSSGCIWFWPWRQFDWQCKDPSAFMN